jgi:hypothetical protein
LQLSQKHKTHEAQRGMTGVDQGEAKPYLATQSMRVRTV